MCGIAGIIEFDQKDVDHGVLKAMTDIQRHRGPDDNDWYYSDHVGLGHARLSIIDLSTNARQPMASPDGKRWMVYNGEIYNYLELREELASAGIKFKSSSDTEVILEAYDRWREGAQERFNGMWAFALWDADKKELFLSRDRFGVKPLYYYYDGQRFIFASEIKAVLLHPAVKKQVNDQAVYDYLISGYGYMDVSDYTFFKDIYKLKPGHYIKVSVDNRRVDQSRYWTLAPERFWGNEQLAVEHFQELFNDAIKLRLRSDVGVGIALSGGLDSSSIACMADKLYTGGQLTSFSSCFEDKDADERPYIDSVLDWTRIKPTFVSAPVDNVFSDLETIIWHQEEPYSTLSILPQWYVMKAAHENNVKVLLTGQAGDEVLAGYHKYYFYLFADLIKSFRWSDAAHEMDLYRRIKGAKEPLLGQTMKILASYFTPEGIKRSRRILARDAGPAYIARGFLSRHSSKITVERKFRSILNNDLHNAFLISPLPSLLHIDDRASMAHSVETRSPFLDFRLVQFLFSLPPEYKIRHGQTKYLLRQAMRGVLPESVRTRKDKMGFPTPLKSWLKSGIKAKVLDIFTSQEFMGRPYFNTPEVMREFIACLKGKDNHQTIWSWINLELWLRKFIDDK